MYLDPSNNLAGINDITVNNDVKTKGLVINTDFTIKKNVDALQISNNKQNQSIQFTTVQSTGVINNMYYNNLGNLTGVNNLQV